MKRGLLVTLFVLFITAAFAQDFEFKVPDYKQIQKEVQNKKSVYYYPLLKERLSRYDASLTAADFQYLYYGYIFDKDYDPYRNFSKEDDLALYLNREVLDPKDYDKIIELTKSAIQEFPFDIRMMNILAYLYHLKGDEEQSKKVSAIFHGILNTIMHSGDGVTCETGFHVIVVGHEYVLLNMLELNNTGQSLVGNCDFIEIATTETFKIKGLYFNIEKMQEKNLGILTSKNNKDR